MPRSACPERSSKAAGFTRPPTELIFVQMLQLQRVAVWTSSSTAKRTAPQWQLPRCFSTLSAMVILRGGTTLAEASDSGLSGMSRRAFVPGETAPRVRVASDRRDAFDLL